MVRVELIKKEGNDMEDFYGTHIVVVNGKKLFEADGWAEDGSVTALRRLLTVLKKEGALEYSGPGVDW